MMIKCATRWAGTTMAITLLAVSPLRAEPVIPQDVKDAVNARIEYRYNPSIVVGVIDPFGVAYYCKGSTTYDGARPVDENTIYEIGSITKVFTSTILADMAERGELSLDDPIDKFLPAEVDCPTRDGKKITLLTLANHTSGLPRLPNNITFEDVKNPYASYSTKNLYEFLSNHEPYRDIGSEYEYSNLGAGLLGHVLALHAGLSYEELVRKRLAEPLGMASTYASVPEKLKARAAPGHSGAIKAPYWDIPALAGAGDLVSTASDMLKFIGANLGLKDSPLSAAMANAHEPTGETTIPDNKVALGWHIQTRNDVRVYWHNGGTGGFRSFCAFEPEKKIGCVVLTNSFMPPVDDIGLHLLDPESEMEKDWQKPTVQVPEKTLKEYEGFYEIRPGLMLEFRQENGWLTVKPTGQGTFTMLAESPTEFFLLAPKARCKFQRDEDGKWSVTWNQGGMEQRGTRQDNYEPPKQAEEIKVNAETLERYVGKYRLMPNVEFTVTRKDDQLYVQLTGQPSLPVYPESETKFFYKVVEASITFTVEDGKATALTLHQGGMDQEAKRIDGE